MRIGIFGGSFNPIHNGHITLGKTMLRVMSLDEVWFMVSPHNPLKQAAGLLDENERFRLVQMALKDTEGLNASDYEFHLPRPSYTWNTLQQLRHDFPNDTFVLIIGGDNWLCFDKWAHNEEILSQYEIAVFPREKLGNDNAEPMKAPNGNVTFVDVPLVNVTSTMLREMLKKGEDVSQYMPVNVAKEIKERALYG